MQGDVQQQVPLHFLVDNLQVWACSLIGDEYTSSSLKLKWMEDKCARCPLEHITTDGGRSYYRVESFVSQDNDGIEKLKVALETDARKLKRLQKISGRYLQKMGEESFGAQSPATDRPFRWPTSDE